MPETQLPAGCETVAPALPRDELEVVVEAAPGAAPPPRPERHLTGWVRRVRRALVFFAVWMVLGNLVIAGVSAWARRTTPMRPTAGVTGIKNFRVVDSRLWRGAAPSVAGYRSLAAAGVRTVVDLRAEPNLDIDEALLAELGLDRLAMPLRDGQTPSPSEVDRFLDMVLSSDAPVFVHCGAGVGRTGTMVASYLVATGRSDPWVAMRRNLAVGPPSLEQLAFVAGLEDGDRPGPLVVAASRVLDAPRRLWSRVRS